MLYSHDVYLYKIHDDNDEKNYVTRDEMYPKKMVLGRETDSDTPKRPDGS